MSKEKELKNIVINGFNQFFNTKYNWSLMVLTFLIWGLGGALLPYSANSNFDMTVTSQEYVRYLCLLGIFFGSIKEEINTNLIRLGVIGYVLSWVAFVTSKSLLMQGMIGVLIFTPLSIFCALILIKHIWLSAHEKE